MLFPTFQGHLNYAARWRHLCLRIRSKFDFFKFEGQSLCARFPPFRRMREKIPQQPISTVIVDVHLYKIFRITDFITSIRFVKLLSAVKKAGESGHYVHTIHITKML